MKYIGLLILLVFIIQVTVAFIKDITYGTRVKDSENPEEIEKKKVALKRGICGIVIESIILLYFGILLLYFSFH